jgi:hypothetical protein
LLGQGPHEIDALLQCRYVFKMASQNDIAHEFVVMCGIVQNRRRGLDERFHLYKSGAAQSPCSALRIFVEPRLAKAGEVWRELRSRLQSVGAIAQALYVWTASALRFQPTTRNQHIVQVAKQPIVIEHPMESRGADDYVEYWPERQMEQITDNQIQPSSEVLRQVLARGVQHVLREVDCDHVSVRQGLQQRGGETSGSATCVEDSFVSAKLQPGEDLFSPADLGRREAMVNLGVPLAHCGSVGHNISCHGFARIFADGNLCLDRVQRLIQIIQNIVYVFDSY